MTRCDGNAFCYATNPTAGGVQLFRDSDDIRSVWAREAKEAERLDKMLKIENEENAAANNLALAIQSRNEARASQSDKFFDALIDKYAKMAEKPTRKKSSPARATKITKPTKKIKKKA
ncbi:hypothetical protein WN55_06137 [Dufourea novaeangliae]|uniref:Uncharacterized protein n=1 Tax=Dufourea novaeangliae TaxID=178035 RepID=A0A154P2A5_DUFNO|nr:hypothetical protein WN55_06137 [Dufourea novaeangliae]